MIALGLAVASSSVGAETAGADAATMWTTPVSTTATAATNPAACGDLLYVGVRGSAEHDVNGSGTTFGRTGQRVRDALRNELNSNGSAIRVRQVYLSYTAARAEDAYEAPTRFADSVKDGTKRLRNYLRRVGSTCPTERWVLSGYSQGAMVVDRVLADFNSTEIARTVGVFNVADPYNDPRRTFSESGTAGSSALGVAVQTDWLPKAFRQVNSKLGKLPSIPTGFNSPLTSYCAQGDPVCAFRYSKKTIKSITDGSGFALHGRAYYRDYTIEAAISGAALSISNGVRPAPNPNLGAYLGRWQGSIKQSNRQQPYWVDLTLTAEGAAVSGTVHYDVPCDGRLLQGVIADDGSLGLVERIDEGRCIDDVDLRLFAQPGGTLLYTFDLSGVTGSGVLSRVP